MRYLLFLLFLGLPIICPELVRADSTEAAKQYKALVAEYEEEGGARLFAKRFLKIAAQHPSDPVGLDALTWVVENVRGRADTEKAIALLEQHHLQSERLAPVCPLLARSRAVSAEKMLRKIMLENKHSAVKAQACQSLADLLASEAGVVEQLRKDPSLAPRVLQYFGASYGKHLASLKPQQLAKSREQVYETMLKSFADVKLDDVKLGQVAKNALFALRNLAVGKRAPEIRGKDLFGAEFKLSEYRGKVVMLSFWGHW